MMSRMWMDKCAQTEKTKEETLFSYSMKKEELISACRDILQKRVNEYKKEMDALQQDLQHESKSTAGDKHETGRAMLHLEAEKCMARLKEAELILEIWDKTDFAQTSFEILPGSWIQTNHGDFLISVPFGRIEVGDYSFMIISPNAPLGRLLNHKRKGDVVSLNGNVFNILEVR